jgi:small subunit ribosomal protein S2
MKQLPTLLEMLQAGIHFGHKSSRWHPKMKPYIFGERNSVHIINLEVTAQKLKEALDFLKNIAASGGVVIFIGTKAQAKEIIKRHALDCGMPYVNSRWLGGTFTNFKTIKGVIEKFKNLKAQKASGALSKYTKKEQSEFKKEIEKLESLVGGIENLTKLPEAIFAVDAKVEKTAIYEAHKKKVPVVGICDSNVDPDNFDYVIPANDDAVKSIELLVGLAAEAIKEGKNEYESKRGKAIEKAEPKEIKPAEKAELVEAVPLDKLS